MRTKPLVKGIAGALLAGTAAFALSIAIPSDNAFAAGGQGQGAGAQKGQGGGHGQGGAGEGHGAGGKRGLGGIFRDITGTPGDDSDAPDWAGQKGGKAGGGGQPPGAGSKKGDLFGDLWLLLRDDDGVPVLVTWSDTNGDGIPDAYTVTDDGFVQPIDADGEPIPLDDEGKPFVQLDADGNPVPDGIDYTDATIEVELGRLNVGRAPIKVLDRRAEEVVKLLETAVAISIDAAGRLVVTTIDPASGDEVSKTIDSPLENLALYVALMTTGSIPGINDLPGEDYDYLVDGALTMQDMVTAASLIAAATDKTSPFTLDEIAYIDAFLGIATETVGSNVFTVIDYSSFDYDRSDTYGDVTAVVLVQQDDGSWKQESVSIYEEVFGSEDYDADDGEELGGTMEAFVQAAEDARMVIEYIHEYAVPVDQLTSN